MPRKTFKVFVGKKFQCQNCDYNVNTKRGMELHMKYSHSENNLKFPIDKNLSSEILCGICRKKNCKSHL